MDQTANALPLLSRKQQSIVFKRIIEQKLFRIKF